MRIDGRSQPEIVRYLNSRKDYRVFKLKAGDHFEYHWDKNSVSNLLADPTYAGIIRYSGGVANLVELVELYDFIPVIDAADFLKVNQAKNFMSAKFKSAITAPRETARASLLNGIIYCKRCGKTLSSGITTSKTPSYRYRCETDSCPMKNKGPRAKIITDFCIDYLDQYRFTIRNNYENYATEVQEKKVERTKELNAIITSLDKQIQTKTEGLRQC